VAAGGQKRGKEKGLRGGEKRSRYYFHLYLGKFLMEGGGKKKKKRGGKKKKGEGENR